MSKSYSGKINKIRYDDPGKPMKQTSFTVKNLRGNIPKKQFTIVKHRPKIRFGNLNFVILDRYICQAAIETPIDSIYRELSRLIKPR